MVLAFRSLDGMPPEWGMLVASLTPLAFPDMTYPIKACGKWIIGELHSDIDFASASRPN